MERLWSSGNQTEAMNNCVNPSRKMVRLPNELRGARSIGDCNKSVTFQWCGED